MPRPLITAGFAGARWLADRYRDRRDLASIQTQMMQSPDDIAWGALAVTDPERYFQLRPEYEAQRRHERGKRIATRFGVAAGLGAAAFEGAMVALLMLGGTSETGTGNADVFRITPIGIDCRVLEESNVRVSASRTFHSIADKYPVLGALLGIGERSFRTTSTFTGPNGIGSGVVANEVCFSAKDVRVDVTGNQNEVITIPASAVVQQTGVVENRSLVVRNDGVLTTLWQTSAHIAGKLIPGLAAVEAHRAGLDADARMAAADLGATACSSAAWPEAVAAATEAYQEIGRFQYQAAVKNGSGRTMPKSITVRILGPPKFTSPYPLPNGLTVTNEQGGPVQCKVDPGAYKTSEVTVPTGAQLATVGAGS